MPWLYHKYVGHDNNRDWFMLTQQETRLTVTEIYRRWRPQIVIDQHQMGQEGPRLFVPPYVRPYEPNVHPVLRERCAQLGRYVVKEMTTRGHEGVLCNAMFDAWTPARAFMHYQGAIRFLTEVASCRTAEATNVRPRGIATKKTPDNPAPWKGGRWGLDDIVRTCTDVALQVLRHASAERRAWLEGFHRVHVDQCAAEGRSRRVPHPTDAGPGERDGQAPRHPGARRPGDPPHGGELSPR